LKNKNIITIDGPSASGKGSLAKAIAKKLDFILLDSGLLYRAYAYLFNRIQKHEKVIQLFSALKIDIVENEMQVFENNANITEVLRQEDIAILASKISSSKKTRDNLINYQRELATEYGLVADGRDMGTIVFPNAATKIFLSASSHERARRRYQELLPNNPSLSLREVESDIQSRDLADKKRSISPLKPADDSFIIDSSNLKQADVLDLALKHYNNSIK
tara:strand:+ start:1163 stop:1819 length:657 start_codon:yes stop_codon:yes gene_type:complete